MSSKVGNQTAYGSYGNLFGINCVQGAGDIFVIPTGVGVSMSLWARDDGASRNLQMAVYKTDGTLVAYTNTVAVNSDTPQWWTATFNGAANFDGSDYYLVANPETQGGGSGLFGYGTEGSLDMVYCAKTFGTWANLTWSKALTGYRIGIYVTYNPPVVSTKSSKNAQRMLALGLI